MPKEINILGIESSCDETGVAIYSSTRGILSHTLFSQIELHQQYGGVVPELASRDHVRKIMPLVDQALQLAKLHLCDIDGFAYTQGPGLNGALLVGATVANTLAYCQNKPTIPIHHLEGHLLSPLLSEPNIALPFIALLVSGGHSQLIEVQEIGQYQIIGDTLDDAAGEAFDKTAKMLDLPYPGGRYIAELAQLATATYDLPRPMLHSKDLTMSFSGLKTAVLTLISKLKKEYNGILPQSIKANIARSIEEAITDVLVSKATLAIKQTNIKTLVVSGGVSANTTLRNKLHQLALKHNAQVYYPPLTYCTDNGAMIALAGYYRYANRIQQYSFTVKPRFNLDSLDAICP